LDGQWPQHRDKARQVGKQPVAYHYIGETVSPAWQVDQTLRWIGAPPGAIPIMVDWEDGSGDSAWLPAAERPGRIRRDGRSTCFAAGTSWSR
jgi:hypothetical protein